MNGGPGTDIASYLGRDQRITATLDGIRNDGGGSENDLIAADVEGLVGGDFALPPSFPDGGDMLIGNDGPNYIDGTRGNDVIDGGGGRRHAARRRNRRRRATGTSTTTSIRGGTGNDSIDGDDGNDDVYGGPGNDNIGDSGGFFNSYDSDDTLRGEDGDDIVDGG